MVTQTFTAELTERTVELSTAVNKSGEGIHVRFTAATSDWSLLTVVNQQQLLLQREEVRPQQFDCIIKYRST